MWILMVLLNEVYLLSLSLYVGPGCPVYVHLHQRWIQYTCDFWFHTVILYAKICHNQWVQLIITLDSTENSPKLSRSGVGKWTWTFSTISLVKTGSSNFKRGAGGFVPLMTLPSPTNCQVFDVAFDLADHQTLYFFFLT